MKTQNTLTITQLDYYIGDMYDATYIMADSNVTFTAVAAIAT